MSKRARSWSTTSNEERLVENLLKRSKGDSCTCRCMAAMKSGATLEPFVIRRRAVGKHDVGIDIRWVGICHTDIHCVRAEWGEETFPMVPGHEITGIVATIGTGVTRFKVGDPVGVGDFVDSCRACAKCAERREQYCTGGGKLLTYGMEFIYKHCAERTTPRIPVTYGGYSEYLVVNERYAARIPAHLDLAGAAPLLCAGITAYNALTQGGVRGDSRSVGTSGKGGTSGDGCTSGGQWRVGVAGLGGIGHVAVKLALAMGAHVTVLSSSAAKRGEALAALGAHEFIHTANAAEVEAAEGRFHLLIDTISAAHDLDQLLACVCGDGGNVCVLGLPPEGLCVDAHSLVGGRKRLTSADACGTAAMEEMLEFCGRHNIVCDVERIAAREISSAFERTVARDVRYRFVVDANTI